VIQTSEIADKVMRQLDRSLQPALINVKLDWSKIKQGDQKSETVSVFQSPLVAPVMIAETRYFVYGIGLPQHITSDSVVVIEATSTRDTEGSDFVRISIPLSNINSNDTKSSNALHVNGRLVHCLAARGRIRELESQTSANNAQQIIDLATHFQLTSKHTSYIAIDEEGQPINSLSKIEPSSRLHDDEDEAEGGGEMDASSDDEQADDDEEEDECDNAKETIAPRFKTEKEKKKKKTKKKQNKQQTTSQWRRKIQGQQDNFNNWFNSNRQMAVGC